MEKRHVQIPAEAFREELDEISLRRRELSEEHLRLQRRAEWLRQGLEFVEGTGAEGDAGGHAQKKIFPPEVIFASGKTRPTIRQAIVLSMKAFPPERIWRPAEVIEELGRRNWLPEAKTAHQMVRNRMLAMIERGELEKIEPGGYYKLVDDIRNTGLLVVDPDDQ
jgi:hypothetical protein